MPPKAEKNVSGSRTTVYLLVLLLCVLGYVAYTKPFAPPPAQGIAPVDLKQISLPPGVLDVPPEKMTSAYEAAYRLKPDRRFVKAIGSVHSIVTGQPSRAPDIRFENGKWELHYSGQKVGTCPELPDFPDLMTLLNGWADKLIREHPEWTLPGLALPTGGKKQITALLDSFQAMHAASALQMLDQFWQKEYDKKSLLLLAAKAWSQLTFLSHDTLEVADNVPAQALAVLSLARAATHNGLTREEAWLAEALRYSTHAEHLAKKLDASDPLRLYIFQKYDRLESLAKAESAPPEAEVLWLFHLTGESPETWEEWAAHFEDETRGGFALVKSGLMRDSFSGNTPMAQWTRAMVFYYLEKEKLQVEDEGFLQSLWDGLWENSETLQTVSQFLEQMDDHLDVWGMESGLKVLNRRFTGPFLNAPMYADFFRGYFYSSLEAEGKHYLQRLSSLSAAKTFIESLDLKLPWLSNWLVSQQAAAAEEPASTFSSIRRRLGDMAPEPKGAHLAGDFQLWYSHWMDIKAGKTSLAQILNLLTRFQQLGGFARARIVELAMPRINEADPGMLTLVKMLWAGMDSRLLHRDRLRFMTADHFLNPAITETLSTSLYKSGYRAFPFLQVWHPKFMGDTQTLLRLLRSNDIEPQYRSWTLDTLLDYKEVSDKTLFREFDKLVRESPEDFYLRKRYAKFLMKKKQYKKTRNLLVEWLKLDVPVEGLERVVAHNYIAECFYEEKNYANAFGVISKVVQSYHGGSLRLAGKILNRMGQLEDAEKFFRADIKRYPNHFPSTLAMAEFLLERNRMEEGLQTLKNFPGGLDSSHWRREISSSFFQLYKDKPVGTLQKAFAEFIKAKFDPNHLINIPLRFYWEKQPETAFQLLSGMKAQNPPMKLDLQLKSYLFLKHWKGKTQALNWLKEKNPGQYGNHAINEFFDRKEYSLLWDIASGDNPQLWLIRAAASVAEKPTRKQRRQLENYFKADDPQSSRNQIGRFLLGKMSAGDLIRQATDPDKRLEYSFYIGWKAEAKGDFYSATRWYRIAIETQNHKHWEYKWAGTRLQNWSGKGNALSYLQKHPS